MTQPQQDQESSAPVAPRGSTPADPGHASREIEKATLVPLNVPASSLGQVMDKLGFVSRLGLRPGEVDAASREFLEGDEPGVPDAVLKLLSSFEDDEPAALLPSATDFADVPVDALQTFGQTVVALRREAAGHVDEGGAALSARRPVPHHAARGRGGVQGQGRGRRARYGFRQRRHRPRRSGAVEHRAAVRGEGQVRQPGHRVGERRHLPLLLFLGPAGKLEVHPRDQAPRPQPAGVPARGQRPGRAHRPQGLGDQVGELRRARCDRRPGPALDPLAVLDHRAGDRRVRRPELPGHPARQPGPDRGPAAGRGVHLLLGQCGPEPRARHDPGRLDVALEPDDDEILRTEDVQVGRRGPTWPS